MAYSSFYHSSKPSSWLGLYNTPTASQQNGKTPTKIALDKTLNNVMVRFQ